MLGSSARHVLRSSGDLPPPDEPLSLAIVLLSSVSVVGLVFSFISHSLVAVLRSPSGLSLVSFLAALFLAQLLFVIGADGVKTAEGCRLTSAVLHACHLAALAWLAVMTRSTCRHCHASLSLGGDGSDPTGDLVRSCIFSWGGPLLSAAAQLLSESSDVTGSVDVSSPMGCWQRGRHHLVYTFAAPAFLLAVCSMWWLARAAVLVRHAVAMEVEQKARRRLRRRNYQHLLLLGRLLLCCTLAAVLETFSANEGQETARTCYSLFHAALGFLVTVCLSCSCQLLELPADSWRRRWQLVASYGAAAAARSSSVEVLTMSAPEVV